MVRILRHGVLSGVVASTMTLLACGGVSHHDDEQSRQNGAAGKPPVDGEPQNGAAGMPQAVDEQPDPGGTSLSLCEGNDLSFGTLPDVARFALDATLDGTPIECVSDEGLGPPAVKMLLKGAKYLGFGLSFRFNNGYYHANTGIALLSTGSCSTYAGAWSTPAPPTGSEYHTFTGTGSITSTTILGADQRAVTSGSLHLELVDEQIPNVPPRILDGHFTLEAEAVEATP